MPGALDIEGEQRTARRRDDLRLADAVADRRHRLGREVERAGQRAVMRGEQPQFGIARRDIAPDIRAERHRLGIARARLTERQDDRRGRADAQQFWRVAMQRQRHRGATKRHVRRQFCGDGFRGGPRRCLAVLDAGDDETRRMIDGEDARAGQGESRAARDASVRADECAVTARDGEPVAGLAVDGDRERAGGPEELLDRATRRERRRGRRRNGGRLSPARPHPSC